MRIFIAGATGVIGRALYPRLYLAGMHVVAASRRPARPCLPESDRFACLGLDILDRAALRSALHEFRPDVVIHLATALPDTLDPRRVAEQLEQTNRLRCEGTRNLIDGLPAGRRCRFIVPGLALAYAPGPGLAHEREPLYTAAPGGFADAVAALVDMERMLFAEPRLDPVVLRLGALYGPDTAYDPRGGIGRSIGRRQFPLVGEASACWSFLHVQDAVSAIVRALSIEPGIYNVVDNQPAPLSQWLPSLASHQRAAAPRRLPAWLARWFIGDFGMYLLTGLRGASNSRFTEATGWTPRPRPW